MKKIFWVLAAVILLSVMACGGGDSTSAGMPIGQGTVIEPDGSKITLADDAIVTFDAKIVNKSTTVVITKSDDASPIVDATAITSTYIIEIDKNSLADAAGDDSDNNTFITLEIPAPATTTLAALMVKNFSTSVFDDAYNVAHVVLEYGDEKIDLFGKYVVEGGNIVIRLTKSALATAKQEESTTKFYIKSQVVNVKSWFDFNVGNKLYEADTFEEVTSMVSSSGLGKKTPLVLIHGWQQGYDTSAKIPHVTTWTDFINYFYAQDVLKEKFMLYSYRYDTDKTIDENAGLLAKMMDKRFSSDKKVVILAHSMGGLISHRYIQKHGGNEKVLKLLTLGTPYHGSPVVQAVQGGLPILFPNIVLAVDLYLALGTPGTLDLRWDNFDDNPLIDSQNTDLLELNKEMGFKNLYYAFAGDMHDDTAHENGYKISYAINSRLGYGKGGNSNDGIVPVVSAACTTHSGSAYDFSNLTYRLENDYDHSQMSKDKKTSDDKPLFNKIQQQLLAAISQLIVIGVDDDSGAHGNAWGIYTWGILNTETGHFTVGGKMMDYHECLQPSFIYNNTLYNLSVKLHKVNLQTGAVTTVGRMSNIPSHIAGISNSGDLIAIGVDDDLSNYVWGIFNPETGNFTVGGEIIQYIHSFYIDSSYIYNNTLYCLRQNVDYTQTLSKVNLRTGEVKTVKTLCELRLAGVNNAGELIAIGHDDSGTYTWGVLNPKTGDFTVGSTIMDDDEYPHSPYIYNNTLYCLRHNINDTRLYKVNLRTGSVTTVSTSGYSLTGSPSP